MNKLPDNSVTLREATDGRSATRESALGAVHRRWMLGVSVVLSLLLIGTACGTSTTNDTQSGAQQSRNAPASEAPPTAPSSGTPAPASISEDLSSVPLPAIVAASAAGGSANPVRPIPEGDVRTKDGKPEVLYIGGEFCPYCAAERWPLTVALSKFGTFSNLHLIHSAESDVPTLTYVGSTYSSEYVTFTPVEMKGNEVEGNSWVDLQQATDDQKKLLTDLGQGSFPFIDFGGRYVQSGGSADPSLLVGKTQTAIASMLAASTAVDTDPSSLQGNVNLVTGEFIRAICNLTDKQPTKVCRAIPTT